MKAANATPDTIRHAALGASTSLGPASSARTPPRPRWNRDTRRLPASEVSTGPISDIAMASAANIGSTPPPSEPGLDTWYQAYPAAAITPQRSHDNDFGAWASATPRGSAMAGRTCSSAETTARATTPGTTPANHAGDGINWNNPNVRPCSGTYDNAAATGTAAATPARAPAKAGTAASAEVSAMA